MHTTQTDKRARLWLPPDDVVGPVAQVKDRLALGVKEDLLGRHEARHHYEEGAIWGPLSIMHRPILNGNMLLLSTC